VGKVKRRPGSGAWREYVVTRIGSLEAAALEAAAARGLSIDSRDGSWVVTFPATDKAPQQQLVPVIEEIGEHLREARRCADERGSIGDWLSGQRVEGAWYRVHHAEALVLALLPPDQAAARVPDVAAMVQSYLPKDDARRVRLERCYLKEGCALGELDPAESLFLADTLRAAYFFSAVDYSRVRNFRNVLLFASLIMSVFVGALLLVGSVRPGSVPLCFSRSAPNAAEAGSPAPSGLLCPTGGGTDRKQKGGDVLIVGLVGLLGAGLAASRALTTAHEIPTRYSPAVAQTLLKLPSGVVTALLGVIALRAGFVPGVTAFDDQADILIWAFVFGFAQQVLTGLIDDRGQQLLTHASPASPAAPPPTHLIRRRGA
jgi:hypothetical protein